MSDVKQFTRELLEGKDLNTAVVGIVTHALPIALQDPEFPTVWMIQHETNGGLYTAFCITRDPQLEQILDGEKVMFHKIAPEKEGYPLFLYVSSIPTPVHPKPEPVAIIPTDVDNASDFSFDDQDPKQFNAEEKDASVRPL